MKIFGFGDKHESGILLASTFLLAILLFNYEEINKSNLYTMFFELSVAGLIGFILAGYYFNKDRSLQERERNEEQNKLKNEFEHRLRKCHSQIWLDVNRYHDDVIPLSSFRRIDSFLSDLVLAFKNFNSQDIDADRELNNASLLIKKHLHPVPVSDMTPMLDLSIVKQVLESLATKYHIDLTPA